MMQGNNAYNVYKNNSVNYASKEQLLLMLLDGAVKFVKMAKQGLIEKDVKKAHENLVKTQNIFNELLITLDVNKGGDWAKNLFKVYEFIVDKLIEVNIKKDVELLNEVIPLIEEIRDTWSQAYNLARGVK